MPNEDFEFQAPFDAGTRLNHGDVLRFTRFTNHVSPSLQLSYNAAKGLVFVAVLLGTEKKDMSERLNLEAAMNELGWFRKKERKKKVKPDAKS